MTARAHGDDPGRGRLRKSLDQEARQKEVAKVSSVCLYSQPLTIAVPNYCPPLRFDMSLPFEHRRSSSSSDEDAKV